MLRKCEAENDQKNEGRWHQGLRGILNLVQDRKFALTVNEVK